MSSITAATGVMMCKEWLHRFDRAAHTGSPEEQGRLRQRKFDGARRWQLETIIDFLPNIVLFSVTLFAIGLGVYLLTVNLTVALVLGVFMGFGGIVAGASILASTVFPLCPYETAASRVLRKAIRILAAAWIRAWRKISEAWRRTSQSTARKEPSSVDPELPYHSQLDRQRRDSSRLEDEAEELEKQHEQQVTSCQAALWFLEMAPTREDQLIAIQFLSAAERGARAAVDIGSDQRRLMVSLTLQAFDFWRSQPNERTQDAAEHFGRALCHVLHNTRGGQWEELTATAKGAGSRSTLGKTFMQNLHSVHTQSKPLDTTAEEYVLQVALLRTLIAMREDIPIDSFRWTKLRLLIRTKDDRSELLGLWAILIFKGFWKSDKYRIRLSPAAKFIVSQKLKRSSTINVAENNFPLALACGVPALKAVERRAAADSANVTARLLDALEIYNTCIRRTTKLISLNHDRDHSLFRDLAAEAMLDMMKYFAQSVFLNPTERHVVDFFRSSLKLLHSSCVAGYKPSLDNSAFTGLWYTLDSIIVAIESSSYIESGPAEDLVAKTFQSISEWLPDSISSGTYSPLIGLEGHPRAIGWIATWFLNKEKKPDAKLVQLMYTNRFRWFAQASSPLRDAWMDAGLSSHLIDGLEHSDVWNSTGQLFVILENITETSPEWGRRLVTDGFIDRVADAILRFDQRKRDDVLGRSYIQCRLLRALLFVWQHCSAIQGIDWPAEKMLRVIERASPEIERLLEQDATEPDPEEVSADVMLDGKAVSDIRDKLISLFNWIEERESTSISRDVQRAIGRLRSPIVVQAEEYTLGGRPKHSRTCSRDSYVDNGLL
ncbi:hypothetical protein FRC05_007195 [Tulasnella sp. 425]|nr:hypothetical protein FRC05_007195 [Tulasnella sp. 425]